MQGRQRVFTDADANAIFARNHGAAELAYYTEYPVNSAGGSSWEAMVDAMVGRGTARRTRRCKGAE